jgi:hypothetical protein
MPTLRRVPVAGKQQERDMKLTLREAEAGRLLSPLRFGNDLDCCSGRTMLNWPGNRAIQFSKTHEAVFTAVFSESTSSASC